MVEVAERVEKQIPTGPISGRTEINRLIHGNCSGDSQSGFVPGE